MQFDSAASQIPREAGDVAVTPRADEMQEDLEMEAKVKKLYTIMQSREKSLGGGEGWVGIYGTITRAGMCKIIKTMKAFCSFSHDSSLVDVGAGLGRPLMHAAVDPGISCGWGIELDTLKCQKAETFIKLSIERCQDEGIEFLPNAHPKITCTPIEKIESLEPYTHAYSFWEGVPQAGKNAFGRLFRKSEQMKGLAVVQRAFRKDPEMEMRKMGFGILELLSKEQVAMSGSGRKFTAYIFKRSDHNIPVTTSPGKVSDLDEAKPEKNESDAEEPKRKKSIISSPAFWERRRSIRASLGDEDSEGIDDSAQI